MSLPQRVGGIFEQYLVRATFSPPPHPYSNPNPSQARATFSPPHPHSNPNPNQGDKDELAILTAAVVPPVQRFDAARDAAPLAGQVCNLDSFSHALTV